MTKILIVDDSAISRTQLKVDLEKQNYTVIEGVDGLDGLQQFLKHEDIKLLISDINMPLMDGMAMCTKIRESTKNPNLIIFMLTTQADPELKAKSITLKVRAWIMKPYNVEKLMTAVQRVLTTAT